MKKRYQVFVSSTFDDLKEERSRLIQALLNIDCIPCGMEYFPAANEDAWLCIERLIPECDYYVVILAGKYGSIPTGRQKSYTHLEYELATKSNVPVIGLLHRDVGKLPQERCETLTSRRKKLEQFRRQVGRKLCRYWDNPDQLALEVIASLKYQIDHTPRTGWVRGNAIADDDAKNEIIKLRRNIELQTKLIDDYRSRETASDSELSSGDDLVELCGEAELFGITKEKRAGGFVSFTARTTWNDLVQFIRSKIGSKWDEYRLGSEIWTEVEHTYVKQFPWLFSDGGRNDDPFSSGEIGKIHIQLNALGLASCNGRSWSFTAKGLAFSSRLAALKKGELDPSDRSLFSVEWHRREPWTDEERWDKIIR